MALLGLVALGIGNSVALASHDALLSACLQPAAHTKVTRLLQLSCQAGRILGPLLATAAYAMGVQLGTWGQPSDELSLSFQLTSQGIDAGDFGGRFSMLAPNCALLCYGVMGLAGIWLILRDIESVLYGLALLNWDVECAISVHGLEVGEFDGFAS